MPAVTRRSMTLLWALLYVATGYRDQEYFFLKIRAAFPGNAR
ncbi:hypothetical protein [Bordetella bronchiseptica]|nr:hypothetical protein [Bordetella bronchiseptica]KDB79197.1 hypothetical protein L495_1142 [Bordetella bronchiseptica CARE970018BB]KDC98368.1 hypothetical protein L517_1099 [Bordetella bronchiseptica MBORD670]KDD34892.1 hypothetical protein L528_1097 [Bordetella bronchiseptica MBORD849]KDS80110.1 transposase [Bordetella bronchiseptica KM22]WLS58002.1 hypothetical protein RAK14_18820 [Bordetella bronchiseptica]